MGLAICRLEARRTGRAKYNLDLAKDLPLLSADPHQLHQVVVNLVTNAHQAMREMVGPRTLTLSTRFDSETAQVRLEVADTGPGIPPEVRARLFEPFFTTKPQGQGTGLGLSLCRGIIEEHGGTISVESEPGQGATFRIELPVTEVRTVAPPPPGARASPRVHRILVVDDEPTITTVLADMLGVDGHVVDTASTGRVALDRLRERSYDLILSDLRMPDLDGPGLYQEAERQHPGLGQRFVFLTGDVLNATVRRFLEETQVPSLSKPFTLTDIRQAIQQAFKSHEPDAP